MRKSFLLSIIIAFTLLQSAKSQCLSIVRPDTVKVPCQAQCVDPAFSVAGIHKNNDYTVSSITYAPQPYTHATPGVVFSNNDDGYSAAINLPFPFGFYDSTYKKIVISTNGLITFDEAEANGNNTNYGGPPLPSTNFPAAVIAALNEDLNLDSQAGDPTTKVDTATVGIAPCRKFIVSWNKVPQYDCFQTVTAQLILYEGLNKIEVNVENRPNCIGEGSTSALIANQNWNRDAAHFPPGRNNFASTITNEAYRYQPSGTAFLFNRAEIYENGSFYTNGFVTSTTADSVNLVIPEICPQEGQTRKFIIKVFYRYSSATADEFFITDSIVVTKLPCSAPLAFTTASANVSCNGGNNGQIIVHATGGIPPYQFSINGTNYFPDSTFNNLTAGPYTVYVKDNISSTPVTGTVTITQPTAITASTAVVNVSCNGGNNGSITVTASGGTSPLQYSLNAGGYQSGNMFSGLTAGTYSVNVKDANNCVITLNNISVTQPSAITASTGVVNVSCNGGNNGSITVTATGGTSPLQYALNAGGYQSGNVFSGLTAGTYSVNVRDANLCVKTLTNIVVTQPTAITASTAVINVSCNGGNNGSITVTASGGTSPFQYALNAGGYQAGNVFSGLTAGTYSVNVRDANLCVKTLTNIVVTQPTAITGSTAVVNVSCNGGNNGSITVTASGGTSPLQYALNAGGYQAGNVFNGLTAGTYSVNIKDANNCVITLNNISVTQPPAITASAAVTNVSCNGGNNGSITVTASGGTSPLQYALNGGGYQSGNVFSGLTAGTYSVNVKDANNCVITLTNITVAQPALLTATAATQNATCSVAPNGVITITAGGGTSPYQYNINGGPFQAGNTFTVGSGSYSISVKDANNCTVALSATVGLTNNLTVSTVQNTSVCRGSSVTLTTVSNAASFVWSPSTGLNSATAQSPVATPLTQTTYNVTATLGQCTQTASVTIGVNPVPAVNAGPDLVIIAGDAITINGSTDGTSFTWSPSTGLNTTNILNPVAKPSATTTYTLTATNSFNCTNKDDMLVTVLPNCIKPRNAFSPNGDGINDKWVLVDNGNCLADIEVEVFDRSGSLVFRDRHYNNTWDGTYKGNALPDATYYYNITYTYLTNKVVTLKGNVTIIR